MTLEAGANSGNPGKACAAFLSHSSDDWNMAEKLCEMLEASGISCWIAPRDVPAGKPYPLGIIGGISASQSLVLLASEKALSSVQVLSEVEQAHKRGMPIYTVLIPPAKVSGEMDFYISRLHWMESGGKTVEQVGSKLVMVLRNERPWDAVASPPTLRRTMTYRPAAFLRNLLASTLGAAVILAGLIYMLNRSLDLDFRRLGFIDVEADAAEHGCLGHLRIWSLASGVSFANLELRTSVEDTDGVLSRQTFSAWPSPHQVGSSETIDLPLGSEPRRLITCLVVPSRGMNALYRVTQRFEIARQAEQFRVAETADKVVSKEDGSVCEARP